MHAAAPCPTSASVRDLLERTEAGKAYGKADEKQHKLTVLSEGKIEQVKWDRVPSKVVLERLERKLNSDRVFFTGKGDVATVGIFERTTRTRAHRRVAPR